MKLLSPQTLKQAKNDEQALLIIRIGELRKLETQLRQNTSKAEADFKKTLADNLAVWEQEFERHQLLKKQMKAEIDDLTAKKMNALIPVGIISKATERRLDDAEKYIQELRQRKEDNEELREKLEDRLDEVGAREQDIIAREQKSEVREIGLTKQEELVKEGNERLSQELTKFLAKKEAEEKDLDERKTAVSLRERSVESKEELQKRTDLALNSLALRLEDERRTLDRAWKELERKKNISPE